MPTAEQAQKPGRTSWPEHYDNVREPTDLAARHHCLAVAKGRAREMKDAVRELGRVSGLRAAERLSRRYMLSGTARLAAAAASYERKVGGLVDADGSAISAVFSAVPLINPWKAGRERLLARPRQKLDGSFRWVYSATHIDHAVHLLIKDVLQALIVLEPTQFMSAGGRGALERWLRDVLPGAARVITTDIPSCFETILREGIGRSLPLPRRVQKAVLFDPKDQALFLKMAPRGLTAMTEQEVAKVSEVGRGIPQGTAPASIVSEAVIGPILKALTAVGPGVRAASFGDNLIVVLRDAADELPALQALTSSVEARFGQDVIGPLTCRTQVLRPTAGFSFCGRDYRLVHGQLRIRVSPARQDKFVIMTLVRMEDARRGKIPGAVDPIRRSIIGWANQNAGLPGIVQTAHELLSNLDRLDICLAGSGVTSGSDGAGPAGQYDLSAEDDAPWVEAM